MPRYYCDYCDTYLTHDSPSVRKQHNAGYKHKANVRSYYQKFEEQQTQTLIDQKIKEHLGQAAVYQQIGAVYNQHLAAFPGQRPHLPVIPPPVLPVPGAVPPRLAPGMRPSILPMPVPGGPGYGVAPMVTPPGGHPTTAPPLPMQPNGMPVQPNGVPIHATATASAPAPMGVPPPNASGAPSAVPQATYQTNPAGSTALSANATASS